MSELDSCSQTCSTCRRFYTIKYNSYVTYCAGERKVEFFLCIEDNNDDKKNNFYIKIIIPSVLVVSLILIVILIWYCKCRKNKSSKTVRARVSRIKFIFSFFLEPAQNFFYFYIIICFSFITMFFIPRIERLLFMKNAGDPYQ